MTTVTPIFELTNTPLPPGQIQEYVKPSLDAFIRVPNDLVAKPYVILSGYQTFNANSSTVSISGKVGQKSFVCESSPCAVDFPASGDITFHSYNSTGDVSENNTANILVTKATGGYYVSIITLGRFVIFSDACASLWQNINDPRPNWALFPQDPGQLNTEKNLHYLASRLMSSGIVDASSCPGGGSDGTAPNPCGLEKVKDKMTSWQNQYDFDIWLTARNQHMPPVMLKSLLELESQFWPITQRLYLDEIGLGQINQLGIDVLLRTNPQLYQRTCANALFDCNLPYVSLSGLDRAMIRGSLSLALDASCPSCQYGVNLNKASQSIPLIAQVVYSNCMQAKSLMDLHGFTASYEDNWKFTMVSYHSGFGCLQSALDRISTSSGEITWPTVAAQLTCMGATDYIDRLWTTLQSFSIYQIKRIEPVNVQLQTPTPIPTPVLHLSNAQIVVKVFVDLNGDGIRQDNEAVDNVQVNLDITGTTNIKVTQQGEVVFDLNGQEVGTHGIVSLPGLYRSAPIVVPESGDLPVVFIFIKPILPTRLP